MVWLMNRARHNPTQEGIFLSDTGYSNVANAVRYFGVDIDVLIAEFAALAPKPPAAFDRRIYQGSLVHSLDLIARDAQDHTNQFQRVRDAGFDYNGGNASVFSYTRSPLHGHAGFNIDWGSDGGAGDGMQPGRGHRRGLMNSGSSLLSNVGIAMVQETDSGTSVGPLVTSIVYARADTRTNNHYNVFIVGTVWEDRNGNDRYDAGEGIDGVSVTADRGLYFAVTGIAGGYAIPATENGTYTLTFSGGDLAGAQQRPVDVSGQSVLVPWLPQDIFSDEIDSDPPTIPALNIERDQSGVSLWWIETGVPTVALQYSTNNVSWFETQSEPAVDGSTYRVHISNDELSARTFFRLAPPSGS